MFEFNFNQDAIEKIKQFKPIDKQQLGLDVNIFLWASQVRERLPRVENKLKGKTDEGSLFILSICEALRKDMLFEGIETFLKQLLEPLR